jgi:hypothetical protein
VTAAGATRSRARRGDPSAAPRRRRFDWLPWAILAGVLLVWAAGTNGALWRTSHWRHYIYLADAFNHGQLHLNHHPQDAGDMAIVGEKVYIVFGPLPAVPLMPIVPFLGEFSPDVLVLIVTALFGIYCFYRLLVAVHGPGERSRLAATTITFALGTAMHYGAPMGNVWLHAQITATTLQCLALWMAAAGGAWRCGLALALAVLTRPTVVLAAPLALWLLIRPRAEQGPRASGRWVRVGVALGVPIACAVALHALYNVARFGSPTDGGYHYILMGDEFKALVEHYGRFHPHFLPHNLFGLLLAPPRFEGLRPVPDPHGMSVLLTSPFLLLVLVPRRWSTLEWVMAATVVLIATPALLYYNDGWVQFGQRFALDWIAPGLLLASFGARRAPGWAVWALAGFGVVVNAWGLHWFQTNFLH